ncbi:hypothetical protein [Flagellimonas olearia]|nr:hypothetical protein [Allomuricauda olearia]
MIHKQRKVHGKSMSIGHLGLPVKMDAIGEYHNYLVNTWNQALENA